MTQEEFEEEKSKIMGNSDVKNKSNEEDIENCPKTNKENISKQNKIEEEQIKIKKKKSIKIFFITVFITLAVTLSPALIALISNNINKKENGENITENISNNIVTNKEENEVSSTNLVIPSDNFYEMRFNLSIQEFCNNYNKAFKEIYSKYTDESFNSVLLISEDTFIKSSINNSQTGLEIYLATFNFKNDANYNATIAIHVEPNTQNIVAVAVMSDYNSYINKNDFQTFITKCIIPSAIRGINKDMTTSEAENLMKRVSEFKKGVYFKDNICCQILNNKTCY